MDFLEYPKIETLYNRDGATHKVNTLQVRWPEFEAVKVWHITEKVDGTNIRVAWDADACTVTLGGRTERAQIPASLVALLTQVFTPDAMHATFDGNAILFMEGYGEKIQKVGGLYRSGVGVRLFDVFCGGLWLDQYSVTDIADMLNIPRAPVFAKIDRLPQDISDLWEIVGHSSETAYQDGGAGCEPEGIVARSAPLMLTRRGQRVMWKLKFKDF